LMDVHTHLCDNSYLGDAFDHWALPAASFGIACTINAKKLLEAGFTTVRNVSEPYYAGVALRDAIRNGWIEGPRMFVSGQMITMTGGHGDWGGWMAPEHDLRTPAEVVADGVDEVRKAVRTHIQHGVDLIKVAATGGFHTHGSIPGAATYSEEELRAAVEEAAKRGFAVAAHAHGDDGIKNAVAAGVRSIEHATLIEDATLEQAKAAGVFLVMDLLAAHYDLVETGKDFGDKQLGSDNEDAYRAFAERFAAAYRAGAKIAFGTDSGIYPHGRNAEQFGLMIEAGMKPIDAIRSATLWAAELLGIEENAGQVQEGMWADLVAVAGDPLADSSTLSDVRFVMKAGKIFKMMGSPAGAE
ncbi:MAG: amidohydrolase family protein, partial [Acidobacteriota bacterium]